MANLVNFSLNLTSNVNNVLNQNNTVINNFINNTNRAQKTINSFGGGLAKIGGLVAGAFAIGKITSFASEIIKAGADMEATRKRFEVFTGSAEAANEQIAAISKLAVKTPFEKKELLDVGAALEIAGVHGEETISVLTKLGNISSATGANLRALTTEIYTKNKGSGILRASDLNQFAAYNLSVTDFASSIGKSRRELYDLAKTGGVTFPMLDKWLNQLGGKEGKFGGFMDKMSNTLQGQWSNLKDTIAQMMSDFGESKVPFLTNVLGGLNKILGWVSSNQNKIGNLFKPFNEGVKLGIDLIQKWGKSFGFTGDVEKDLENVVNKVQKLSNELGVLFTNVVENVGVVGDAFGDLWNTFDKLSRDIANKSFGQTLVDAAREIGAEFMEAANFIGNATRAITHAAEVGRQFATNSPTKWADIYRADAKWSDNEAKRWATQDAKALAFRLGPQGGFDSTDDNSMSWDDPKTSTISKGRKLMKSASSAAKDDSKKIMGDVTGTRPTNVYLTVNKLVAQEIATQSINNIKDFDAASMQKMLTQIVLGSLNDVTRLSSAQQ